MYAGFYSAVLYLRAATGRIQPLKHLIVYRPLSCPQSLRRTDSPPDQAAAGTWAYNDLR